MSLSVLTNISSLVAQNNLSKSQSTLNTAIERLSSGKRINSAKDDAAGLAISTRFTTQINGLNQAVRNSQDGISLAQTTESALNQVTDNLQRIRELAVQSANASNSSSDRAALNQEVQQRLSEVTRIAQQTSFNGLKVLDGSQQSLSFQVGANAGQVINVDLNQGVQASQIGQLASDAVDLSSSFTSGSSAATAASVDSASTVSSFDFSGVSGGSASTVTSSTTSAMLADFSTTNGDFTVGGNTVTLTKDYSSGNVAGNDVNTLATDIQSQLDTASSGTYKVTVDSSNNIQIATTAHQTSTTDVTIGATGTGTNTDLSGDFGSPVAGTADTSNAKTFTIDGNTVNLNSNDTNMAGLVTDVQGQLDSASSGTYTVSNDAGKLKIALTAPGASSITVGGTDASFLGTPQAGTDAVSGTASNLSLGSGDLSFKVGNGSSFDIKGSFDSAQSVADAINAHSDQGISAYVGHTDGKLHISAAQDITTSGAQASTLGFQASDTVDSSQALGNASVATVDGANNTINSVDAALQSVSTLRSTLGAVQNRFDSTISNLQTISQNLDSSRSSIQDADFAAETAKLSSAQILQQAGVSVLAKANTTPQLALKLLQ